MYNKTKMFMKMTFSLVALFMPMGCVLATNSSIDNMIAQQANVLTQATSHVTKTMNRAIAIKTQATHAIDDARKEFIRGKKTLEQFTEILHTNNARIANAEQDLKKMMEKGIKRVKESEQHMDQFFSQTKEFDTLGGVLSHVGMENVQDIKEIAQRKTKGLIEQKEAIKRDYELAKKDAETPRQQQELKNRYSIIIKQLDADIAEQQIITGEVISIKRKAFWDIVDRARKLIDATIESESGLMDLSPEEEERMTKKLEKSAYEAEEKTRLLAQKMAAEQDLDVIAIQQDEVQRQMSAKIAEQEQRDKEREIAQRELRQLKMQQEELLKQAEAKTLEKTLLEKEEYARLAAKIKATQHELDALQLQHHEMQKLTAIQQAQHVRLQTEKNVVCADVEQLKVQKESLQQEAQSKSDQQEQLNGEYIKIEQERDAIEQELYALELRKKELRKQAEANALVHLKLSMTQGVLKADVRALIVQQEKCIQQLGRKTELCKQLCTQEEMVQAQLNELTKKAMQIEAQTKAKMVEKTQLEHERKDMQLQQ